MLKISDEITVLLECPECTHHFEQSLAMLKDDPIIACPSCDKSFKVESKGTVRNITDQMDEIDRLFDKISKG
jgi:predicted nucleic acid-binding Zn ribbon protein